MGSLSRDVRRKSAHDQFTNSHRIQARAGQRTACSRSLFGGRSVFRTYCSAAGRCPRILRHAEHRVVDSSQATEVG